jgi:hypothetical protein
MGKRTNYYIASAILFLLVPLVSTVSAETLILKSGKRISGKVIARTEETVTIEVNGEPATFLTDEIQESSGGSEDKSVGNKAARTVGDKRRKVEEETISGPVGQEIAGVIKNFFEHRFDNDPQKAEESVSDSFKSAMNDYESSVDKQRRMKPQLASIDDFRLRRLVFQGRDIAVAIISFQQALKSVRGSPINNIRAVVILEKEAGAWKITNILSLKEV